MRRSRFLAECGSFRSHRAGTRSRRPMDLGERRRCRSTCRRRGPPDIRSARSRVARRSVPIRTCARFPARVAVLQVFAVDQRARRAQRARPTRAASRDDNDLLALNCYLWRELRSEFTTCMFLIWHMHCFCRCQKQTNREGIRMAGTEEKFGAKGGGGSGGSGGPGGGRGPGGGGGGPGGGGSSGGQGGGGGRPGGGGGGEGGGGGGGKPGGGGGGGGKPGGGGGGQAGGGQGG